jgi:hypothetical protein
MTNECTHGNRFTADGSTVCTLCETRRRQARPDTITTADDEAMREALKRQYVIEGFDMGHGPSVRDTIAFRAGVNYAREAAKAKP